MVDRRRAVPREREGSDLAPTAPTLGRVKVLLLENIHPVAVELLEARGHDVELRTGSLSEDELVEALAGGVQLLGIRSNTHVTSRALAAATELMAIGCFCIGTNQVDLDAAERAGIPVFNAPYSNCLLYTSPSPRDS